MLSTASQILSWHSLASLLLLKSCFQAEDVGVVGKGDFLQQEQKTSDCVLWQGASSHPVDVSSEQGRAADLGTGAGFPGVVIRLCRPDLDLTLIEATDKKLRFAAGEAEKFGLPVTAVHMRG